MNRSLYVSAFKRIVSVFCIAVILILSALHAGAMNFEFNDAAKSVFVIASGDPLGNMSLGSGFSIDKHYIITNAHVISDKNSTAVICFSETAENNIGDAYDVTVVAMDETLDLAILYLPDIELTPLHVADVNSIKEGDEVYAIGAPEGLAFTLTKGTISSKLRVSNNVKYVQTDAAINHGNSGGPLLNTDGNVIGVNTLKLENSDNIGFAIRVDMVTEYYRSEVGGTIPSDTDPVPSETVTEIPTETVIEDISGSTVTVDTEVDIDDTDIPSYIQDDDTAGSLNIIYIIIPVILAIVGVVILVLCLTVFSRPKKTNDDSVPRSPAPHVNDRMPDGTSIPVDGSATPLGGGENSGCIWILKGNMAGMKAVITSGQAVILGKDPKFANVVFDNSYVKVSRIHCTITYSGSARKYLIVDSSSNGTYFEDGTPLPKNTRTAVEKGTVLKLADDNCKIKLI